jgi:hypothetical protein
LLLGDFGTTGNTEPLGPDLRQLVRESRASGKMGQEFAEKPAGINTVVDSPVAMPVRPGNPFRPCVEGQSSLLPC